MGTEPISLVYLANPANVFTRLVLTWQCHLISLPGPIPTVGDIVIAQSHKIYALKLNANYYIYLYFFILQIGFCIMIFATHFMQITRHFTEKSAYLRMGQAVSTLKQRMMI